MTFLPRVALGVVTGLLLTGVTSCPKPPPVVPPKPETTTPAPAEPEPPPVKRPTPPEDQGAVPEFPPPIKP